MTIMTNRSEASAIPHDAYTPHGYLHVPGHTRNMSIKGVVRSHDAGFRFHVPAYAGMYGGRRETYRAGMSLAINGATDISALDRVTSPTHTKNQIVFEIEHDHAAMKSAWNLIGDDVLMASIDVQAARQLAIIVEYRRTVSANGEWGESGLVGRVTDSRVVLQSFEDGDAFVFASTIPIDAVAFTENLDEAREWIATPSSMPSMDAGAWANALGSRGDTVTLHAVIALHSSDFEDGRVFLARGATVAQAEDRLAYATEHADAERARQHIEDDAFWRNAPVLHGDWPEHWRRGLVYDFETLRMMVMKPIGIYDHMWDGMQIQAPRVVLGEAAIDALLLSYADPALAQELLHGTFADAPEPNVPCSREDGTYNMVSARGSVCGTGPQWGYPFLVLDWLWRQHPDRDWLERIYPRLTDYLDWWILHRTDDDGWLWFECSWESGQDGTPRLGDQPLGGGHPTPHVRPVDLHASVAHAGCVMARFAHTLGRGLDERKWNALADDHRVRTRALWNGDRFADFDSRAESFTDINDVMLYAPIQLGVATPEQAEAERAAVCAVEPDSLVWPMFAWTVAEAATMAGEADFAVDTTTSICDRAWGFWDARTAEPDKTMPGITCEYWPVSGQCGGEGYGWGAFGIHLLFRIVLGYDPQPDGLSIAPNLPTRLRRPDAVYEVRLSHRGRRHAIKIVPCGEHGAMVRVDGREHTISWGDRIQIPAEKAR